MRLRSICFLLLFALPMPAAAWGPAGHRIVATLAEAQLRPAAKAEIRRLTRGQSLADIATWADDLRDDPSQLDFARATAPLHYVNFADAQCRYDAARDCRQGSCVVAAIERYAAVLADRNEVPAKRAQALRFVVHFVADTHQPLHAGYRDDRGGNRYQVQFEGRGTNLHAIWDSKVLASRGLGWPRQARVLARTPLPRASGTPAQWAEESCRATRDGGVYPPKHRVDRAWLEQRRPLAERQARLAAARLALVLEQAIGTSP
ncbi:MAG: S1/P1 Nuclease [Lysobacteraceae bacterium]|nr:MAG: S1/P1 Nuclease [Xanthomonadaceae bacterium]